MKSSKAFALVLSFLAPSFLHALPSIGDKYLVIQNVEGKQASQGDVVYVVAHGGTGEHFKVSTDDWYREDTTALLSIEKQSLEHFIAGLLLVIVFILGWNSRAPV